MSHAADNCQQLLPMERGLNMASSALASHVSDWQSREHMEERARRGSWAKFKAVLAKAPDVEPSPHDQI